MNKTLVEACHDGDVSTVRKLLTEGGSVHETSKEGVSLLSLACSAGYYELVQVLLTMQADVEYRGIKRDRTPLMEAASAGFVEIVRLLLAHGAVINAFSSTGDTPLMYACVGGHVETVKEFLNNGANIDDYNEKGHTSLMKAAGAGHVMVAKILLEYGAGINTYANEFKESALTLASYNGHLEMVQFLLASKTYQEHQTDEIHVALKDASIAGHVEIARFLLDSGAQVNLPTDNFESPLTLAACGGYVELASLLIDRGAEIEHVNNEEYTPLMEAAREGHIKMVSFLLDKGANVNAISEGTQETALTLACCGGFLHVVYILLKNGATLELGTLTPLMEASQEGHVCLVQYLLEHGANVHAQTPSADTALIFACENGYTDVADLLLQFGSNLEHESEDGCTPLMKACQNGHLCTVQFLISKKADINRVTANNDHTPLSLACGGGHLVVVQLLLGNGADPFYKLKDNSTMVLEAAKGGYTNVVMLLLDYTHSIMMLNHLESVTPAQEIPADESALSEEQVMSEAHAIEGGIIESNGINAKYKADSSVQTSMICEAQLNAISNLSSDHLQNCDQNQSNEFEIKHSSSMDIDNFAVAVSQLNLDETSTQEPFTTSVPISNNTTQTQCTGSTTTNVKSYYKSEANIYYGINVDAQTERNHDTALTVACAGGHEDLVKLLLVRGANIEHRNNEGLTPLQLAVTKGFIKIVEILLNNAANMEAQLKLTKDTSLSIACSKGHYEICELLLQRGANKEHRNNSDYTPLILAASYGYVNIIKLLLNNGAEINSWTGTSLGVTPLMLAAMNGYIDAVKLLLDLGSDVNAVIETNRNTALTLACFQNQPQIVSLLLDRKANVEHRNKIGLTPLMEAANCGNVDVGKILIDKGADVNAKPVHFSRDTALILAAYKGHRNFVELLLKKNASIEVKNKKGSSPLWLAAHAGHLPIIELLYNFGANLDSQDNRKVSCLMSAFRNGHVKVVKWMVNHVSQFPSDQEMTRFVATLSDKELIRKCQKCMLVIGVTKDEQEARANKNASILLEELDMEKNEEQKKGHRKMKKKKKNQVKSDEKGN